MGACCGPAASPTVFEETKLSNEAKEEYLEAVLSQWASCLKNPDKLIDTAASKRSPFKFHVADSHGNIDLNLGVSAVARPDMTSDFGQQFQDTIDKIQDIWWERMPTACKRQTTPHMSIGSVVLDKKSVDDYNSEILRRTGLIANVKQQLDSVSPPPRAKIQTLKINPDGCVTFQLEHDPAQDVEVTEKEFEKRLGTVITCQGEAAAGERKKFKRSASGGYILSRFQQVRLALGEVGCEIKGMYPAGHMVVVNLVDPQVMEALASEDLKDTLGRCYEAFAPLIGTWFELNKVICLCYVERSLNEGSVVLAPAPGTEPKAFPESEVAQGLLGGLFTSNAAGDVLVNGDIFKQRTKNRAAAEWQSFSGEIKALVSNVTGKTQADLLDAFKLFDKDGSGSISTSELGAVMEHLGEKLTPEQLSKMMRCADHDSSGTVDYQEFLALMRKTN